MPERHDEPCPLCGFITPHMRHIEEWGRMTWPIFDDESAEVDRLSERIGKGTSSE